MKRLLANDLVIQEDNCNLSCRYCLTGQSNFKSGHSDQLIFLPPRVSNYLPESDLGKRIDCIVESAARSLDLPIVKVTGGEIFLIRNIMDLLRRLAEAFATLVIQTNGVLVTLAALGEIGKWGNACLQISLDSVSYSGNSYRAENVAQHNQIMERIYRILDCGIPTEIYCVLSDRSLPELETTLTALKKYRDHVVVYPFPVRGPDRQQFYPQASQTNCLQRLSDRYPEYSDILPPKAYLARLIRFFEDGERRFRCHLPRFAFTTFDDGYLTSCPNIWFNKIGNLFSENAEQVTSRLGETPFYKILLADKPRIDACKACFTPWDMLSMYVDGEISLDDLCRPPSMYSAPASRVRIQEITEAYRRSAC